MKCPSALDVQPAAVLHERRAPATPASTKPRTRSRWRALTSGPMSEPSSAPLPTVSVAMRSRTLSTSSSAIPPTATATDTAMQRWPAEP